MRDHKTASIGGPWSAGVYVDLSIDQRNRNINITYFVRATTCRRRVEEIDIEAAME